MNNTNINFLPNDINKMNNVETLYVDCIYDRKCINNCISVFSMYISSLKAHI